MAHATAARIAAADRRRGDHRAFALLRLEQLYPLKRESLEAMLSPYRTEALAMIREKCQGAYSIVREGEAKGRARVAGAVEGGQEIVRERRWGIDFRCK